MRERRARRRLRYAEEYPAPPSLPPDPWGGVAPPVTWGGGMVYGLTSGGPAPFEPLGAGPYDYAYDFMRRTGIQPRLPPEESPYAGRQADRAVRRWAREHGYAIDYALRPRSTGGRYQWRGERRRRRRDRR